MLTHFQKKKLTHLFYFFDRDKNGFIEANELDFIIDNLATSEEANRRRRLQQLFQRFWRQLIDAADENGDKKISLEEFLEIHKTMIADSESYQRYIYPFIETLFPLMDLDGDNRWDLEEFQQFYKLCEQSSEEAAKAFLKMDSNQDGFLSHLEVSMLFREFYLSSNPNALGNNFFGQLPTI